LFLLATIMIACESSFAQVIVDEKKWLKQDCNKTLRQIEERLFLSCPISKGPVATIHFLENEPTFIRDKRFDELGFNSVMFNAKNASFQGNKLADENTWFSVHYEYGEDGSAIFSSFHANYYFQDAGVTEKEYDKMIHFLEKGLGLTPETRHNMLNEAYYDYTLPCGSSINIHHSHAENRQSRINVHWEAYTKKDIPDPPDIPIDQLRAAPQVIQIDGKHLTLSTSLWRDFMPSSPENPSLLNTRIYVTSAYAVPIPNTIVIDAAWLVYNDEVWKSWLSVISSVYEPARPDQIKLRARHGPTWNTDVPVDVIVRVNDSKGNTFLLQAPKQSIGSTY
jgi:hypothetical protein